MELLVATMVDADEHVVFEGHPERHQRLEAVECGVRDAGIGGAERLPTRLARFSELSRVHDELYLEAVAQLCDAGGGALDPDTVASPGSWRTVLHAAGLGLSAIDALRSGAADSAFVAPRPPGHHALRDRATGFCLVNNIAVAAAALVGDGERVAIFDWDVHHGNGTQATFWDEPRVLYASIHQWPAYPGTGRSSEVGGLGARGTTVNVPVPPGATGDVALSALDAIVEAEVERFAPTWVLVSAGFDAHRDDPLGDLAWSDADYVRLVQRVLEWAPRPGRLVVFLEGGYDLGALRRCVHATVSALAGERWTSEAPTSDGPGMDAVARAAAVRATLEVER